MQNNQSKKSLKEAEGLTTVQVEYLARVDEVKCKTRSMIGLIFLVNLVSFFGSFFSDTFPNLVTYIILLVNYLILTIFAYGLVK